MFLFKFLRISGEGRFVTNLKRAAENLDARDVAEKRTDVALIRGVDFPTEKPSPAKGNVKEEDAFALPKCLVHDVFD